MYWQLALSSAVQVGIGLAGFSGIIAALRSGQATWNERDRLNLQVLLGASGWSILFSLIPFVALEFLPSGIAWNVLSFVYATIFVGIAGLRVTQFRRGTISGSLLRRIIPQMAALALILVANGLFLGASWPYVGVVIWQLVNAFLSFARLLLPGSIR